MIMELAKSTHEIIKQDSVASIETEGLLGNQFLAISFGSAGSSRGARWRDDPEPAATRNGGFAQKDKRHSG